MSITVLAIIVVLEHAREPKTANRFPSEDIEDARLKVLPYRQSGLIFSWGDDQPTIYVNRARWEALPEDVRRNLGQAMAVAKDLKEVRILDGASSSLIGTCTAAGRCREPVIETGAESLPRGHD